MRRRTQPCQVELLLVNLASDDDGGILFDNDVVASMASDAFRDCATARHEEDEEEEAEAVVRKRMTRDITRFFRPNDRYAALASTLLKSRAFHETHACHPTRNRDERSSTLPVVELPRTRHGRPYVPPTIVDRPCRPSVAFGDGGVRDLNKDEEEDREADAHPLSVSHQHPHVGLARLLLRPADDDDEGENDAPPSDGNNGSATAGRLRLGMDIVVFDRGVNVHRKNATTEDDQVDGFLQSFQGSFTTWEWDRIMNRSCTECRRLRRRRPPPPPSPPAAPSSSRMIRSAWGVRDALTRYLGGGAAAFSSSSSSSLLAPCRQHRRVPRLPTEKLREFYLRWSVKESYTKALGLGMGVPFDSFETRLAGGIDECYNEDGGNWDDDDSDHDGGGCAEGGFEFERSGAAADGCSDDEVEGDDGGIGGAIEKMASDAAGWHGALSVRGCTRHVPKEAGTDGGSGGAPHAVGRRTDHSESPSSFDLSEDEIWDFAFISHPACPGNGASGSMTGTPSSSSSFGACACVCLGPVVPSPQVRLASSATVEKGGNRPGDAVMEMETTTTGTFRLRVEQSSLLALIRWHREGGFAAHTS